MTQALDPPPEPAERGDIPAASVVISSRNRPRLLRETVASVLESQPLPAELVVIDQSDSPDDHLQRLSAPSGCQVRYSWSRSVGVSRARNEGAATARHQVLAFLDDDVLVAPDWFGILAHTLVQFGPRAVVTGRVLATADTASAFAPSTKSDSEPAVYVGRRCEGVLFSNSMAAYRSMFSEVGGFDERLGPGTRFPAAEDNDLCWRLLGANYRIIYEPRATIYHRAWRSVDAYQALRWKYGRGQGAFYAKHLDLRDSFPRQCAVSNLRGHVARLAQQLRRGRLELGELAYVLGVVTGLGQWLLVERAARHRGRDPRAR